MGTDKQRPHSHCASGRKQVHGWLNPVDAQMFLFCPQLFLGLSAARVL
jgi:hypothetical protein